MSAPIRNKLEPGIYERVDDDGQRLGLEIVYKDTANKPRRRTVHGDVHQARDQLANARVKRTRQEREPDDPRVTFDTVADAFEAAHVANLRPNSQKVYRAGLRRLRATFGPRRLSSLTKADLRAYVASERKEKLKANTIISHLAVLSAVYGFARDDLDMPVTMPRLKRSERPRPADDEREHRILTDDELARILAACTERERLFFGYLAETGARKSEGLGLRSRRVGTATVTIAEQLDADGELAPIKNSRKRTIETTRGLTAQLALSGAKGRVFEHLTHGLVDHAWQRARKAAKLADPQPVIHDLRHTHVSGLIADGWDPVEIANRIGDTLQTTLQTYSHAFDERRRGDQRRAALEARYGSGNATEDGYLTPQMATKKRQQTVTGNLAEVADLQAVRRKRR
jgi:integrase